MKRDFIRGDFVLLTYKEGYKHVWRVARFVKVLADGYRVVLGGTEDEDFTFIDITEPTCENICISLLQELEP